MREPGPFANSFKGFASSLITAAFSFGGTEMIALTASESSNVRHALPKAIKQVFWRIVIFYLGSIIMIATLVPYNDKDYLEVHLLMSLHLHSLLPLLTVESKVYLVSSMP